MLHYQPWAILLFLIDGKLRKYMGPQNSSAFFPKNHASGKKPKYSLKEAASHEINDDDIPVDDTIICINMWNLSLRKKGAGGKLGYEPAYISLQSKGKDHRPRRFFEASVSVHSFTRHAGCVLILKTHVQITICSQIWPQCVPYFLNFL